MRNTEELCEADQDGMMVLLEDDLSCHFCKGEYVWRKKEDKLKDDTQKQ